MQPEQSIKYVAALTRPFDPEAEGAQVPDQWSFPTATAVLRGNITLSTRDTTGNVDFVIQPNVLACVAASNSFVGTNKQVSGPNEWYNTVPAAGLGFSEIGLTNATLLAAQFARYRVVGFGVRIRSLVAPLNQQGKFLFCKVPSMNTFANYAAASAQYSTWGDYLSYYELPGQDTTGYVSTGINSLPTVHETMQSTLSADGGLEVCGSICSPVAYEWRDGANAHAMGHTTTGLVVSQGIEQTSSTLATLNIQDPDFLRQGGWSTIVCRGNGLFPSSVSAGTAVLDIEVCFHLEGIPPVSSSSAFLAANSAPPIHMGLLQAAQAAANMSPHFQKVVAHSRRSRAVLHHHLNIASRHLGFSDVGHFFRHFGASDEIAGMAIGALAL